MPSVFLDWVKLSQVFLVVWNSSSKLLSAHKSKLWQILLRIKWTFLGSTLTWIKNYMFFSFNRLIVLQLTNFSSHLWERFVLSVDPASQWTHERSSIELLDYILESIRNNNQNAKVLVKLYSRLPDWPESLWSGG